MAWSRQTGWQLPTLLCVLLAALACGPGGGDQTDAGTGAEGGVDAGPAHDAGPYQCGELPLGVAEGQLGLPADTVSSPVRRLVLMGGSAEDDNAARLFVEAAAGGDVLVLRASGAVDTYTPYFYQELGATPTPASVTTLRTDDMTAAADPALLCRVGAAEAVWLAGGDQWDYLGLWPPALQQALAEVATRGGAVGGTSAGAVVLGEVAFDAEHGGLTSATALQDPLASYVSISQPSFAQPELDAHLVDSHFTERDREGRLLVFLARARALLGASSLRGVGLDERAALLIEAGRFQVYAEPGRSAWIYELTGVARIEAGAPLDLSGVTRVQLSDGDGGSWPLVMQDWVSDELQVLAGQVQLLP